MLAIGVRRDIEKAKQVLMTKFDAEWMLRLIERYRCTFSYAVPTATKIFFETSEHADGERRGTRIDLKAPKDASRRDLSDDPPPIPFCPRRSPSACAEKEVENRYAVPTVMKRVWDLPDAVRRSYDVSSLRGVFHMAEHGYFF